VLNPSTPTRGFLRWVRAGAVSTTVLGLAAGAHVAAGGRLPGFFLLGLLAVGITALCALVAGRRFSWPAVAALLGLGQFALHTVFAACSAPVDAVVAHHDELFRMTSGSAVGSAQMSSSPLMTGAHVGATVLALLALMYGEHLLWSVWSWLRPVVRLVLTVSGFVVPEVPTALVETPVRPRSVVARRVRRRGPPRVPAFATTF